MSLAEYYNLPEGTNVFFSFIPSFFDTVEPNFPCPSSMRYAFAYYGGSSIPKLNVSNVTNMQSMFYGCNSLISIIGIENWDVSNVTNMNAMFYGCNNLTSLDVSNWDTSKVTDMRDMFSGCSKLTLLDVSNWDVSKVTTMYNMFYSCKFTSLDVSNWDTSKVTTMGDMFGNCSNLETLSSIKCSGLTGTDSNGAGMFGYGGISTLKNFGGWIGLKKSVTNYGINKCPNLTYESCINVLNGLYDFTGNGVTPASNEGKLKVHSNFLTLVGDELSIGTNKGWTITA